MPQVSSTVAWLIFALVLLIVLSSSFLGVLYFVSQRAFHVIFDRPFPRPAYDRSPMEIKQDTIYGRGQNWFYTNRLDFKDLTITSYDGLELAAYYRPAANSETRLLVVLIHGWRDTPAQMAAFAQMYLEKADCHILIPHLRAHGMSMGNYIGYGLPDSQDILMWTEYMEKNLPPNMSILYHGWSMGASTALMAAESGHLSHSVVGLVVDCPYDSLENQIRHIIRGKYHFAPGIFFWSINRITEKNLGYPIKMISPIARAGKIEVPVLIIHGTDDTFVPMDMSEAIYNTIQSPKRIVFVQGAGHIMSFDVAPSTYSSELDHFLRICQIDVD